MGNNKRMRSKALQQKQKKKKIVTGTLAVVLLLVLCIGIFCLNGCSNYETDTNTVYFLKDGKIVSNTVESFDESAYDTEELKTYITEMIDTYNETHGTSVKQKSLKIEEGMADLVMEYESAKEFSAFEDTELFMGTIADALQSGYTFEGDFADVTDGKQVLCTSDEFLNQEYQVIIIKADVTVSLEEGEICYVTSKNTKSVNDGKVVIEKGAALFDETGVYELDENTEGVEDTEADEVISEDELLTGEEEVIFDFGDVPETDTSYDDVYTYIVYK